jgi:phage-related protein
MACLKSELLGCFIAADICLSAGKTIFLLRVFIKKTQKTPSAEIRLALKRQQEMLDEQKDD